MYITSNADLRRRRSTEIFGMMSLRTFLALLLGIFLAFIVYGACPDGIEDGLHLFLSMLSCAIVVALFEARIQGLSVRAFVRTILIEAKEPDLYIWQSDYEADWDDAKEIFGDGIEYPTEDNN